jgi:hypothetical protein
MYYAFNYSEVIGVYRINVREFGMKRGKIIFKGCLLQ